MRKAQMDCSRVQPLLEEYFEGTLGEGRLPAPYPAALVADHLATCARCAAELHQIARMVAAFEAIPQVVPSRELLAAITSRVAKLPAPRERRTASGWRWVAVTAAISMAALGAISYLLPLLITERLAADIAALGKLENAAILIREWFAAAPAILLALWVTLGKLWQWFALTARAVAPTVGAYLAVEVGILCAIVFVLHARGRRTPARQTLLI
jgi:predicted anti-sigma-YlaC factor YlaD